MQKFWYGAFLCFWQADLQASSSWLVDCGFRSSEATFRQTVHTQVCGVFWHKCSDFCLHVWPVVFFFCSYTLSVLHPYVCVGRWRFHQSTNVRFLILKRETDVTTVTDVTIYLLMLLTQKQHQDLIVFRLFECHCHMNQYLK